MNRRKVLAGVASGVLAASLGVAGAAQATGSGHQQPRPTVVLVHGAFEDASAWTAVTRRLQKDGYPVVAPAVPLRGLASDAAYLGSIVTSISGPVVLAGHSFGGMLISDVAAAQPAKVKALVYVAAFIPRAGESAGQLNGQFPGSLVGPETTFTRTHPGGTDLYAKPATFRAVFAGESPAAEVAIAAAGQRPIEAAAFGEVATRTAPATIPAYALIATRDKAIPPAAERFMARRAGARITEVAAAHNLPVSKPGTVTDVIERAARGR